MKLKLDENLSRHLQAVLVNLRHDVTTAAMEGLLARSTTSSRTRPASASFRERIRRDGVAPGERVIRAKGVQRDLDVMAPPAQLRGADRVHARRRQRLARLARTAQNASRSASSDVAIA